ncbi:hypothetical protein Patl1_16207 [Pistacia atlantica]|uniref:Uncharacterized protein n=1 Tax=Pistacia atlantica TaxID=434234 RepID=A0ACC1BAG4_9ROSI|nr:hypothetical protein Patl1_16207 [Pistacia atlantica]
MKLIQNRTINLQLSSSVADLLLGFNRDSNCSEPCIPGTIPNLQRLDPTHKIINGHGPDYRAVYCGRKTKLDLGSTNIRVKVIGSLISIMGAIVVEIYKGPYIRKASSQQLQTRKPSLFVFYSTPDRWLIGGILLLASSLSICIWNIIQLGTIRQYPQVMKVVSFYSLAGTIQCAIFSLIVERDLDAWKLKLNLDLLLIIATAIFTSIIRSSVHISCTQMKGPLYVPMFKPFGIVFATAFGVGFFTNSLRYGSVIGAVITGMGYYTIMWGHVREGDELDKRHNIDRLDSSDEKVPLLEEESEV